MLIALNQIISVISNKSPFQRYRPLSFPPPSPVPRPLVCNIVRFSHAVFCACEFLSTFCDPLVCIWDLFCSLIFWRYLQRLIPGHIGRSQNVSFCETFTFWPPLCEKSMMPHFEFFKCLPFHMYLAYSSELGCITNFDMLFLVMGFIALVDEIQFMLISSRHICIRLSENVDLWSPHMSLEEIFPDTDNKSPRHIGWRKV